MLKSASNLYGYKLLLTAVTIIFTTGMFPVYALVGVQFFMSIISPTIFSLSIEGLGKQTKLGSSLLAMAIAGGAIFPVIKGKVSDLYSIQMAYLVPAACFLVVLAFAWKVKGAPSFKPTMAH